MPIKELRIRVKVLSFLEKDNAIAYASSYLSFGDDTNIFNEPREPTFDDVEVHTDDKGPVGVTLTIMIEVENDKQLSSITSELKDLEKVKTVDVKDI